MKEISDINIGYKLQHLIPAFFVIVIGFLLFIVHWIFVIPVVLFGISLLCMRSGVEIDITNKQIRMYSALSNLKFGSWTDLKPFNHIELKYTNESQTMSSRGSTTTVRTKTYDLVFYTPNGKEEEFNDFTDYKIATQVFKIVANSFGMSSRNIIEEMVTKAKERYRK